MSMKGVADREFKFEKSDFEFVAAVLYERSGIVLHAGKESMVYGRLSRRLRALQMNSFKEYCSFLKTPAGDDEFYLFLNALTTNLTKFFRESHHFDHLRDVFFPEKLAREKNNSKKRLRMWSAAASSGEEPYSIAMVTANALANSRGWDAKILATDIDTNMIDRCKSGIYGVDRIETVPNVYRKKFVKSMKSSEDNVEMSDTLKQLLVFKNLNLLAKWPVSGPFDVIFCRNVAIYFDRPTQKVMFERFADLLDPNGYLYIGHSENLFNITDRFKPLGNTIYQKAD